MHSVRRRHVQHIGQMRRIERPRAPSRRLACSQSARRTCQSPPPRRCAQPRGRLAGRPQGCRCRLYGRKRSSTAPRLERWSARWSGRAPSGCRDAADPPSGGGRRPSEALRVGAQAMGSTILAHPVEPTLAARGVPTLVVRGGVNRRGSPSAEAIPCAGARATRGRPIRGASAPMDSRAGAIARVERGAIRSPSAGDSAGASVPPHASATPDIPLGTVCRPPRGRRRVDDAPGIAGLEPTRRLRRDVEGRTIPFTRNLGRATGRGAG